MPSALEQLLSQHGSPDRYATPPAELLPLQLEAANERLELQVGAIPLLRNRVDSAGIKAVERPDDLVPLLFAHNTYKTYAETWLAEGQWDRMAKWLATVSMYEPDGAEFAGVSGLDEWIARLEVQGSYLASSSGTTGRPALLSASDRDLDFGADGNVHGFTWATGIQPTNDHVFFGLGPPFAIARNERIRQALVDAFNSKTREPYQLPVPPISTESVMAMILLRKRIADGIAAPSEVAEFERLSGQRQAGMEAAQDGAIAALIEARGEKLLLSGFIPHVFALALGARGRGYSRADFAENALLTGGGLKGAVLPPDYREVMFDTFNLSEDRLYHFYSMQELNSTFPRCRAGRYHVPPWVIVLPLDTPGEVLLDATGADIEARAAFLDLSLEGRWGGVISGDRVSVDFRRCACGCEGPHFGSDIVRYSELEGGDKISCAGTIDAYIRGEG